MIYVIDHKDSFTHNVVHQFSLFDEVQCDTYNDIDKTKLNKSKVIVFSPGPGNPKNYPLTSKIYNQFKGKKKIIGICLGFPGPGEKTITFALLSFVLSTLL